MNIDYRENSKNENSRRKNKCKKKRRKHKRRRGGSIMCFCMRRTVIVFYLHIKRLNLTS